MQIYQDEINDKISDAILNSNSIAYSSILQVIEPNIKLSDDILSAIARSMKDTRDLYPAKSIMVSTVWNGNDDVFLPLEAWNARHSPEDKPFNYQHNERDIIGHITSSFVMDSVGNMVADATSEEKIPENFHIVTSLVLYKYWRDKELQDRMNTILVELSEAKWFVSMECLFGGFDYALRGDDKVVRIIPRTEQTAFLTKYLRIYGGSGKFKDQSIGRVLRNIMFRGEGLVRTPANPESHFLTEGLNFEKAELVTAGFLTTINKENSMSVDLEKKVTELEAKLNEVKAERDRLLVKDEAVKSLEAKLKSLETDVVSRDALIAEAQKTITEMKTKIDETEKALTDAKASIAKTETENRKRDRLAKLIEAGTSKEDAAAKVEKFINVDEALFDEVVAYAKALTKKPVTKPDGTTEEVVDPALASGPDVKTSETVVASLAKTLTECGFGKGKRSVKK